MYRKDVSMKRKNYNKLLSRVIVMLILTLEISGKNYEVKGATTSENSIVENILSDENIELYDNELLVENNNDVSNIEPIYEEKSIIPEFNLYEECIENNPVFMDNLGSVSGDDCILDLGEYHSAVIKEDGSLWTWGENYYGALGINSTVSYNSVPIKIMDDVKSISMGVNCGAAIKKDGSLWTWGDNSYGQLGNGTTETSLKPIKIMESVSKVSMSGTNCAVIKNDGSMWVWGDNTSGQLGNDSTEASYLPIKLMDNVNEICMGANHSAAIKEDGSLWTWGANFCGQLGDGTTEEKHVPQKVMDDVKSVCIYIYSAAIKKDGSLWMWGESYHGGLGKNGGYEGYISEPIKVLDNVKKVSLGAWHSAAIKEDGSLWTWGDNYYGQLGIGSTGGYVTACSYISDNCIDVSLGGLHSATIEKDGNLFVWGNNYSGEVGDGTTTDRNKPVFIMNLKGNNSSIDDPIDNPIEEPIDTPITADIYLPNDGRKTINYNSECFSGVAYEYNPSISELAVCLSTMVYERSGTKYIEEESEHKRIANQFIKLGFDHEETSEEFIRNHYYPDITGNSSNPIDRGNYSPSWITHRTIKINNTEYTLLSVVIRGTYNMEWIDNFDSGTGETHAGFERAANYVCKNIEEYIVNNNLGDITNFKVLVTGHSRGAAVANIVGKNLDDNKIKGIETLDKKDIYVYTYATPNVTCDSSREENKYSNIFNIVNPEDFVTKVLASKWGYGRYGITYVLPSKSIYPFGFDDFSSWLGDGYTKFENAVKEKTSQYIGASAPDDALMYREYNAYNMGMAGVMSYISLITSKVKYIYDYYDKNLSIYEVREFSPKTNEEFSDHSLFAMFTRSLAYYMAGSEGSNLRDIGLKNLIAASAKWGAVGTRTTTFFLYNGKLTSQFGSAHAGETYMAMLDLVSVETLKAPKYYHFCRVNCPVDIVITDSNNNIIGSIIDNTVETSTEALAMNVEGDSKSFIIPEEADYMIKLVGNNIGSMDYTISEFNADTGEVERVVYQDVKLKDGLIYTQNLDGFANASDAPLFDENGKVVEKTIHINENNIGKLSIDVSVVGKGYASGYESVTPGDYITLYAEPDLGNEFDGWYDKEGNLISTDTEYGLSVKKSEEFIAKFKEVNGIIAAPVDPQVYTGFALTPDIALYDGTQQLIPGTDYTVSYKNNKNAFVFDDADALTAAQKKSAPQAIIKMKGNYSGQQVVYFSINPLSIEDNTAFEATLKKGKKQTVVFTYNGKALKEKTDYTVDSITDASVTITGKGNFTGTQEFTLTLPDGITNVPMSKVMIDTIPAQYYTGTPLTGDNLKAKDGVSDYSIRVTYPKGTELKKDVDYTISEITNPTKVGTATVVIKGLKAGGTAGANSKYSFVGEKRVNVKINPRPIDSATITCSDGAEALFAIYDKAGAKPEGLTVAVNEITLKEGRDYTVKYSANTQFKGTGNESDKDGMLTVTGKGNYKGSKKAAFKIRRRPFTKEAGITVVAVDKPQDKKPGKYATTVKVFDSEGKLLKAGTDYEKEIAYLAADGTPLDATSFPVEGDIITVRITGKGAYSDDIIETTYKILKAGETTDISKADIRIEPFAYKYGTITLTGDNASHVSATIGKEKKELTFSTDGINGDFMVLPGSYVNNDKKGTATVTFVGINGCSGCKTVKFKIGTRSLADWWRGLFR